MKIKNINEPQKFFEVLKNCKGKIELVTSEGDRLNRLVAHGNRQRGIITAGLPFLSLMDVLETAAPKPDILKKRAPGRYSRYGIDPEWFRTDPILARCQKAWPIPDQLVR